MWEQYYCAGTLDEALELLHRYQKQARIIAGGTDLLLEMMHGKRPDVTVLIDITRIPELNRIHHEGGTITLGAMVSHNLAAGSAIIREYALPLAQACWEVGAPQIRNRGTIAGNLVTGSAANDTIPALIALGAKVTLASVNGSRDVLLADFYRGLRQTVLQPDEILSAISFPALRAHERGVFLKLGLRRAQAISVVNTAVVVRYGADAVVEDAIITLGSVAPTIIRAKAAEDVLMGKPLTELAIREAAQIAASVPRPITDVRSTAEYRSEMVRVLVGRALRAVLPDAPIPGLPENPAMLWGDQPLATPKVIEADASQVIECTINGEAIATTTGYGKTLLNWLRDDVGLTGSKEGCGEGECGACTVFLDGAAVMSCMVPAPRAHGAEIITIEGVGQEGDLHPIQDAFIASGAVQCGYCTPGFIMSGVKLLEEHPHPDQDQIQQGISGNLCRCTGYAKIVEAIITASAATRKIEER